MATEKKIMQKAMKDLLVKRYLEKELHNAGVSSIQIQKTPLATRIAIRVRRPSMVIGKKGKTVKLVSDGLEKTFGIENPQLDIIEVEMPELDAKLVAEKIARQIEIEGRVKQIVRMNLRDIIQAGAVGAEIIVAGKVVGKGGKSKTLRARHGFLKKSGELMKMVNVGKDTAYLKAGAIGVRVKIVPPGTIFPDVIRVNPAELAKAWQALNEEPIIEAKKEEAVEAQEAAKVLDEKVAAAKEKAKEPKKKKKVEKPKGEILTARDPQKKAMEGEAAKGAEASGNTGETKQGQKA